MKSYRIPILLAVSLFCISAVASGQGNPPFDVDAYKQFLTSHQNLTTVQLHSLYPAGTFAAEARTDFASAQYFDSVDFHYKLTTYEKYLLRNHGFVVTERLRQPTFADAFLEIYNKDLPVFVSIDAILHALHMSMDEILMEVERSVLSKKLDILLASLHGQLPSIASKYSSTSAMKQMVNDVDVYLTVPRVLLGTAAAPAFSENATTVQELLTLIAAKRPAAYELFSDTTRTIDFSQFTVRGHYTQSPELSKYFQAMIWLGRTEIYLVAPKSDDAVKPSKKDIQRQTIDAVVVSEAAEAANAFPLLEEIDGIIRFFVG